MGRFLSKGIRIYEHASNGMLLSRKNYSYSHGMNLVAYWNTLRIPSLKIVGTGCEEGAMVVHFRWA